MDHDTPPGGYRPRQVPELRLDLRALDHNVQLMAAWCRDQGVELAPHIKTTMTRPIVERQMAAGAWGVTVATVTQAGRALEWGTPRVIIANQVVHRMDLALIRRWLDEMPRLEVYCFVDSLSGVDLARSAMDGTSNPLRVLIDIGADGGRTGVREPAVAGELAKAVQASPGLLLAGVAGYEGVRPNLRDTATLTHVDEHCQKAIEVFRSLTPLFETVQPVFSMGGSAFPDRVVHALPEAAQHPDRLPALSVLRSGCYVTHDHGTYEHVSPLPGLFAALTVRAVVVSTPEPGMAVIGAGKRELPYDAGLPVLISAHDPQGLPRSAATAIASQIYDHHLVLTQARGLSVGDEVDLGISHPCSAFDRWPDITVIDDQGRTHDVWHPQFH
ncbi:alanine racemase [Streptomyces sp. DR7-3]|uniref:alanine racemase n=1 Tax=Streptomyces malaysiensis TaxID=92644 RepID=UPI00204346F8|nr:alanine racemase [Streptomyces sp. DR7-3]MCM3812940.1 alanine racemase [Streptomyces sp. DR7-3]